MLCGYLWCYNLISEKRRRYNALYCCRKCGKKDNHQRESTKMQQKLYNNTSHAKRLKAIREKRFRQTHGPRKLSTQAHERRSMRERISRRNSRVQAQLIVGRGRLSCMTCCRTPDEISDVESIRGNKLFINHDNGDGWKDRQCYHYNQFYKAIIRGERKVDDLSLRCVSCHNNFHMRGLGISYQSIPN